MVGMQLSDNLRLLYDSVKDDKGFNLRRWIKELTKKEIALPSGFDLRSWNLPDLSKP